MHIQFSDKTRQLPRQYVRHISIYASQLITEAILKLLAYAYTLF